MSSLQIFDQHYPDVFEDIEGVGSFHSSQSDDAEFARLPVLYESIISRFESLVDQTNRILDDFAAELDDLLLKLRIWATDIKVETGSLELLDLEYHDEAEAVRINLQNVSSALESLETENLPRSSLIDPKSQMLSVETLRIAVHDLAELAEPIQIFVDIHRDQGPLSKVKRALNKRDDNRYQKVDAQPAQPVQSYNSNKNASMQNREHHHLIVGIDFGTTYSSVGFSLSSSNSEAHEVIILGRWPDVSKGMARMEDKVPSQITYEVMNSSNSTSNNTWGYQIEPYMTRCTWMKLYLDNHSISSQYDDPELQVELKKAAANFPTGKTAQEVTSDYLKELYAYTMQHLEKTLGRDLMAMTNIKFWFSMPAIWSDEAQAKTREAALAAKFGTRLGDEICMIKEPEAAALAILSEKYIRVRRGEGVMVVDCGGGTVDLTTYTITQSYPKFILREVCIGIGAKFGAISLERNLYRIMNTYFGEAFSSIQESKASIGSRFMKDFEWNKRRFGEIGEILRPMELFLNGVSKSQRYLPERGHVILDNHDMEDIFDPLIAIILQLVEQQFQSVRGSKISHLVLVGGFGNSPYLKKKLGDWCNKRSIVLKAPANSRNAVVRGAILRGLGQASVNERLCRRHYGVECAKPYRSGINTRDFQESLTKEWYSLGCVEWFTRKGQTFDDMSESSYECAATIAADEKKLTLTIVYSNLDKAPEKVSDHGVQAIGKGISIDLTHVDMTKFSVFNAAGDRKIKLFFTIGAVLGDRLGTILFPVKIDGKLVGQGDIRFSQE